MAKCRNLLHSPWVDTLISWTEDEYRPLTPEESALLDHLLGHHDFPGRDGLSGQLSSIRARRIDEYGTLQFSIAEPLAAKVIQTIPVEAEYLDDDGVPVWVMLHVAQGVMHGLEISRADGRPLISPPTSKRLEPFSTDYPAMIEKAGGRVRSDEGGKRWNSSGEG